MDKREFIKTLGAGALGLAATRLSPVVQPLFAGTWTQPPQRKYWAWITKDFNPPPDDWKRQLALMHENGIDAILPEVYDSRQAYFGSRHLPVAEQRLEMLLPLARAEGVELHAWIWSMPCNIDAIVKEHPDWYVVNRKGESAAEKPAYVPYYKFLCPSRPEVHEFLRTTVAELCQYDELTGVHFDYIRYPDVILAEGLQPKYGIVQVREYPEYDYCYCSVCRHDFQAESGIDPLTLDDPAASGAWRQFRYDRITRLVNDTLIPVVHQHKKVATAAVFPNWESVRQQWSAWKLDAALPMLYNGFYKKGIEWIGEETRKEVEAMRNHAPVYSGLFVPHVSPEEMPRAVDLSLKAGANGVVLFASSMMTEEHWKAFRQAVKEQ